MSAIITQDFYESIQTICVKLLHALYSNTTRYSFSLNLLDQKIAAGMPSSRGEDWQPLLTYRNTLVHGEAELPPQTSKRAYTRKRKDLGML